MADDYINVLVQRAKEINSGVWIQVSQRSRTKIPKEKGEDKGRENEAGKEKQKKDNYYGILSVFLKLIANNRASRTLSDV